MKVYPKVEPNKCFHLKKTPSLDLSRFGYREEIERYNKYHPLNLYIGIFVFLFDLKIMILSLILNNLTHKDGFDAYHNVLIFAIQILALLKLVLYISNNVIERKEASLLISLNHKTLFNRRKYVFFYFYVMASLINHVPLPKTSSYYTILTHVKAIDYYYEYNIHDFFTLICIIRSFGSVLFVLNNFPVNQTKYRRVVANSGIEKYENFTLRYFFTTHPITFSFVFLMLFLVASTLMIQIIERPNPVKNFAIFANSLYFITTTITTLGYGDYTPKSDLGRIVSLFIMIIGLVNINLINYAMLNYIKMTAAEEKSLNTLMKMNLKERLTSQYISLFLNIRRSNKLLVYRESFMSKALAIFYMQRLCRSYRQLREYKIKYDKMNYFMATEGSGSLKKNLEFKFSIFSSMLDIIKQNTVAINKNILSNKPNDMSISSKMYELLRLDSI